MQIFVHFPKNTFFCFPTFKFAVLSSCNITSFSFDLFKKYFSSFKAELKIFFYRCSPENYTSSLFCVPMELCMYLYSSTSQVALHLYVCMCPINLMVRS